MDRPYEISVDDVRDLSLENYLLKRDVERLRAANTELQNLLQQAAGGATSDLPRAAGAELTGHEPPGLHSNLRT